MEPRTQVEPKVMDERSHCNCLGDDVEQLIPGQRANVATA